jgi:4-aminobutyrate aminotransferase-like enzyme
VTISVGHCHPHVVEAARKQNELLQHSTTIYLHPNITAFGEALAAKMPGDLKVCYFVNSGSEANDLALLMARAYTGNYDMIALRNAYHGGNASGMGLTAHRTWKFNVPHSFGVHHALTPILIAAPGATTIPTREEIRRDVQQLIDFATPGQIAGFIAESIQGRRRRHRLPDGYLKNVYEHVRAAGGVCIATKCNPASAAPARTTGAFETQGVIPDIVCMAKGIGNGAPLGAGRDHAEDRASARRPDALQHLRRQPRRLRARQAVLEVIEREGLAGESAEDRQSAHRRPEEAAGETQHHRPRARQGSDARHRAGERPRDERAGESRDSTGPRDGEGDGPVVRQRRIARTDDPLLAADVRQRGRRRVHPRRAGSFVRRAVAIRAAPAGKFEMNEIASRRSIVSSSLLLL